MANSVNPDQEQSDLGLHCLHRPVCPDIMLYGLCSTWFITYGNSMLFKGYLTLPFLCGSFGYNSYKKIRRRLCVPYVQIQYT